MSLFYLCQEYGCKRKYKTSPKLIDHMLKEHKKIISEPNPPVEITNETDKNKDRAIFYQQALAKTIEVEKIKQQIFQENIERSRRLEEKKMELQESQIEIDIRWTTMVKKILDCDNENVCTICVTNPMSGAINPCGHACFCYECITKYHRDFPDKPCPFCRKNITSIIKIYTS